MDAPDMRSGYGLRIDSDGVSHTYSLSIPQFFTAAITGSVGCSGVPKYMYAWKEVRPSDDGISYVDKESGRVGTIVGNVAKYPAFETNNAVVPVGAVVFMRERSVASGFFTCPTVSPTYTGDPIGMMVYEFLYGAGSGGGGGAGVTSVQCTGGSLVVTYA